MDPASFRATIMLMFEGPISTTFPAAPEGSPW